MDRESVIVGLSGGLGNQLFQYAAGRALSLRLETSLKLDLSWFLGRGDRFYGLSPFAISSTTCVDSFPFSNRAKALSSRISRRLFFSRMGVPIRREPHYQYDPDFKNIQSPCFLEGYWQSETYFKEWENQIREDLKFRLQVPDLCKPVLDQIESSDAICVHVRRGDYIENPQAASTHGTCSLDYYKKAVNSISGAVRNPRCFVFSDDLRWVRKSLHLPVETTFVDINSTDSPHWDLYLMSKCNHFVIANSSFSWWGAWLGGDRDKRVIAPSQWFLTNDKNDKDLLPTGWERM